MKSKNKIKEKLDHATIAYKIEKQDFNQFYSKSQLELYLNSIGFNIYVMDSLNYPTLNKIIQNKLNLAIDSSEIIRPMWLSNHHDNFFSTYGRMFTIFEVKLNKIGEKYAIRLSVEDIDNGDNRFNKVFKSEEEFKNVYNFLISLTKEEVLDVDLLKDIILEYKFERD